MGDVSEMMIWGILLKKIAEIFVCTRDFYRKIFVVVTLFSKTFIISGIGHFCIYENIFN